MADDEQTHRQPLTQHIFCWSFRSADDADDSFQPPKKGNEDQSTLKWRTKGRARRGAVQAAKDDMPSARAPGSGSGAIEPVARSTATREKRARSGLEVVENPC